MMGAVIPPPAVSIPRKRGATSRRSRSWVFSEVSPLRMAAWTAAPYATASLGLIDVLGSLQLKESDTSLITQDTSGTADQDDLVYLVLVDLGVDEDLADGLEGAAEEFLAELFETRAGEGGVEVDTLEERVVLNQGLVGGGEGTLGRLW